MSKMELRMPEVKNVHKHFFLLLILFSFSCTSQRENQSHGKIYNLLNSHIKNENNTGDFLYKQTIHVKNNSHFDFVNDYPLSEVILDSVFRKNCVKVLKLWRSETITELNLKFKNLKSVSLEENFFKKPVLNENYLEKETYVQAPNYATVRITYPILIEDRNKLYAFFVEDSHNEGGIMHFYMLEEDTWRLICKDTLWIV